MRTSDFDFELPAHLIAQQPASARDQSRLLVLHRADGRLEHRRFSDVVTYLRPGDVLVVNDSRVVPARLRGVKAPSGAEFEMLLLEENDPNDWWAMLRPGKRARIGTRIQLKDRAGRLSPVMAEVREKNAEGHGRIVFEGTNNILKQLEALGEVPLPPYIQRGRGVSLAEDITRYQTVYARVAGSVAAPTAGLHFTPELMARIRSLGVRVCAVTLHVGLGTFAPVKAEEIVGHTMHEERFEVSEQTAREVNLARAEGRRVIAVGTTSVRVLESVTEAHEGQMVPGSGRTRIFIHPPRQFRIVDALLTNFHLPRSTLVMLVSALAAPGATGGRELVLRAYVEAVRDSYRFFSYGDAMLIL